MPTAFTMLSSLMLGACLLGGGGSNESGLGTRMDGGTYRLSGDSLIETISYTGFSCDYYTGQPSVYEDSYEWATPFVIEGKTWTEWEPFVDTAYDDDNEPTGTFQFGVRYVRRGSGTGHEGVWKLTSRWVYRILSGTLSPGLQEDLDRGNANWNAILGFDQTYRELHGDSIRYWRNLRAADLFIFGWNGGFRHPDDTTGYDDKDRFDIEVSKLDQHTVKLRGRMSGEIVTYRREDNGSEQYASNRAEHPPYGYDADAIPTCDTAEVAPTPWYFEFLEENDRFPPEDEDFLAKRPVVNTSWPPATRMQEMLRQSGSRQPGLSRGFSPGNRPAWGPRSLREGMAR